ncbi:hypothetical protein GO491_02170 [Flavobacteriaceae bacterium Ap0902]|nr:hypothetical protein [Flavobacteriaceae bacterium Ap0902]
MKHFDSLPISYKKLSPPKKTIDFILAYSKSCASISVKNGKKFIVYHN